MHVADKTFFDHKFNLKSMHSPYIFVVQCFAFFNIGSFIDTTMKLSRKFLNVYINLINAFRFITLIQYFDIGNCEWFLFCDAIPTVCLNVLYNIL